LDGRVPSRTSRSARPAQRPSRPLRPSAWYSTPSAGPTIFQSFARLLLDRRETRPAHRPSGAVHCRVSACAAAPGPGLRPQHGAKTDANRPRRNRPGHALVVAQVESRRQSPSADRGRDDGLVERQAASSKRTERRKQCGNCSGKEQRPDPPDRAPERASQVPRPHRPRVRFGPPFIAMKPSRAWARRVLRIRFASEPPLPSVRPRGLERILPCWTAGTIVRSSLTKVCGIAPSHGPMRKARIDSPVPLRKTARRTAGMPWLVKLPSELDGPCRYKRGTGPWDGSSCAALRRRRAEQRKP